MRIDAALAAKLTAVLKKLLEGKTLAVAAADAGLSKADVDHVAKALQKELAPAKKATGTKTPSKRAHGKGLALIAYADGGSRGNPGKAACAAIITDAGGEELLRRARLIGKATNNVAEYEAVRLALELCAELGASEVTLRLDSELVVRQIEGRYKVKHPDLLGRYDAVRMLISGFHDVRVEHIPREENKLADKLVNAALDGKDLEQ